MNIQTEKDAVKIILALINYDDVSWSRTKLTKHFKINCNDAILFLRNNQYIVVATSFCDGVKSEAYFVTETGREYVKGLSKNSSFDVSSIFFKFREEALSGMKCSVSGKSNFVVSSKSNIKSAVLSTVGAPHTSRTPEDMIIEQDLIIKGRTKIAAFLKLSIEDCEILMKNGQIKMCKYCGKIGVFSKHKNGTQHMCRKCINKND